MVEYYYTCKSYRKIASLFGINVKTVVKWVNGFKEEGLEGLRDLRIFQSSLKKNIDILHYVVYHIKYEIYIINF
jgi:transposase